MPEENKFTFYQVVALFLSEIIRSRKVNLRRGAEIAQSVINSLSQIKTEEDALLMITNIQKDFEEVAILKQALHFGFDKFNVKVYEKEIKEFASKIFVNNMAQSADFLQNASREDMTIQELCLKYPEFCRYLNAHSETGVITGELREMAGVA